MPLVYLAIGTILVAVVVGIVLIKPAQNLFVWLESMTERQRKIIVVAMFFVVVIFGLFLRNI